MNLTTYGNNGAGIWYHMSTFFSTDELGVAYTATGTSTGVGQVRRKTLTLMTCPLRAYLRT